MADNKSSTKTIPVELLLSGIGQQVKVDIEAHRQRLLADIEERRQKLAELRRRRQELLARTTTAVEEPEVIEEPVPAASFLAAAAPLTDDSDEDWLAGDSDDDTGGFTGWDAAGVPDSPLAAEMAAPLTGEDISGDDDGGGFAGWDGAGVSDSPLAADATESHLAGLSLAGPTLPAAMPSLDELSSEVDDLLNMDLEI